jgi:hypothetical protein
MSSEFFEGSRVQLLVTCATENQRTQNPPSGDAGRPEGSGAIRFSFGSRRYATTGPRRLFVPQECYSFPAFEPEVGRPLTTLRGVANRA